MSFWKREKKVPRKDYDREHLEPVIRSSICTGEKVAGFLDSRNGKFLEGMLLQSEEDLKTFKQMYGITNEMRTIY